MKRAVVILEVIVSIVLFSVIAIISSKMIFVLVQKNYTENSHLEKNIILETTRLFLIKNNNFAKIRFNETELFYDNNLLLSDISKYEKSSLNDIVTIDICIDNNICQYSYPYYLKYLLFFLQNHLYRLRMTY